MSEDQPVARCPLCGQNDWSQYRGYVHLMWSHERQPQDLEALEMEPVAAQVCQTCGYIALRRIAG